MWNYEYPDHLYHHGVKGMRWGVKRAKNGSATSSSSSNTRKVNDETTRNSNRKHRVKRAISKGKAAIIARRQRKVLDVIKNTSNVASGALRVAALASPAAPILGAAATVASAVGVTAGVASGIIANKEKEAK